MPAAGAAFVYRALDVRAIISEEYVPALYLEGDRLEIIVRDRNGRPVGAPGTLAIARWLEAMRPELWTLLLHQRSGDCDSNAPADTAEILDGVGELVWAPDAPLQAGAGYTAELVAVRGAETRRLHGVPFSTGPYETPEAHVRSGLSPRAPRQRVRTLDSTSGLPTDLISELRAAATQLAGARATLRDARARGVLIDILDARTACDLARGELESLSAARFTDVAAALGIGLTGRPLPPHLELSAVPVPDGRVLLVESPAPLDFTRIALTHDAAGATLPLIAFANRDGTRGRSSCPPRAPPLSRSRATPSKSRKIPTLPPSSHREPSAARPTRSPLASTSSRRRERPTRRSVSRST